MVLGVAGSSPVAHPFESSLAVDLRSRPPGCFVSLAPLESRLATLGDLFDRCRGELHADFESVRQNAAAVHNDAA